MDTEFTLTQKRALAIFTVIALLFGAYFLRERSSRWAGAAAVAIALWAAGNVVDNARMLH